MSGHFAAKFTFVFINLLFLASGITLTIAAALGQSRLKLIAETLKLPVYPSVTFVLAIGIIVIAISLLGLFAGCSERNCLLTMFGVLLILILLIQFSAAVTTFVYKNNIVKEIENSINSTFIKALKNVTEAKDFFDQIQKKFQCCGLNNVTDYVINKVEIPKSCCLNMKNCTENKSFKQGCEKLTESYVAKILTTIALVVICLCGVDVVQIIFTFCFVKSMNNYIRV